MSASDASDPTGGRPQAPPSFGLLAHSILGLVSVGLAAALAEVLAAAGQWIGALRTTSSPADALGDWFITVTPQWLKRWAIAEFGTGDKTALLIGMAATVTVAAVLIGVVARRRVVVAVGVSVLLVAGALTAVLTRPDSRPVDAVPTVVGALFGLALLGGGARVAVHARSRSAEAAGPVRAVPLVATPAPPLHPRRQFVRLLTFGTVVAAATGALSRLIPKTSDVEASRARIAIPVPSDSQPIDSGQPSSAISPSSTPTGAPTSSAVPSTTAGAVPPTSPLSTAPSSPLSETSATSEPPSTAGTPPTTTSTAVTPTASSTAATTAVEFPSISGLSPFVTPSAEFYRIDTALSPPLIRAEDWSLRIHGMVDQEVKLNYFALMAEPQVERSITLTCVSNPVGGHLIGNATWIGVRIDGLLRRAGVLPGSDCVLSSSSDGFTSTTPLAALTDGRDALLAVAMNGAPLPIEHGFPVRMVVPGLYGYVSATKWVVDLEVTTFAANTSYWTSRGYAERAPVKMSSRIDVPAPYTPFSVGDSVVIAGMAWAQHDGISAVQVQFDNGPWQAADLAGQLSIDTWRQWRYRWKATAGSHIVRCRAVDRLGAVQDATIRDVLPDGATGYASLVLMVS